MHGTCSFDARGIRIERIEYLSAVREKCNLARQHSGVQTAAGAIAPHCRYTECEWPSGEVNYVALLTKAGSQAVVPGFFAIRTEYWIPQVKLL